MAISQNFPIEGPTLNLNFAGSKILDPRITFTRTTSGTYLDDDGLIATAPAGSPRFDHRFVSSTGELESLGLLIEEQRSNILRYSEDFSQTGVNNWDIGQPTNTRSSNATLAPDGNTTADKLIEGTSSVAGFTFYQPNTVSGSGNVCFSCFLKASERRYAQLDVWDGNTIAANALFDLQTGSYLSSGFTGGGSISIVSYGITPYPNGWYRCHLVVNRSSITYLYSRISICATNPISTYTGTGTSGIFVWGAQLEVGAFPTSYIPTVASAVTRNADDARMTGTNFSSWYNQSLGTFVCVAKYTPGNTTNQTAWSMYNGATGAIRQMLNAAGGLDFDRGILQNEVPSGTYSVSVNTGVTANRNNLVKIASAFQTDNFAISQDGSTPATDTSGTMSNHVNLFLGATVDNTWFLNVLLSQLIYYPVRVSNSQLQILSR